MMNNLSLACDLMAVPADHRAQHHALAASLFEEPIRVDELETGYQFVWPVGRLADIGLWMGWERLCCPFIRFQVDLQPAADTVTVSLTGGDGVKALLKHEMGLR